MATFFGDFSEKISEIKPHLSGSFYKQDLAFSLCHLKKDIQKKRAKLLKACNCIDILSMNKKSDSPRAHSVLE